MLKTLMDSYIMLYYIYMCVCACLYAIRVPSRQCFRTPYTTARLAFTGIVGRKALRAAYARTFFEDLNIPKILASVVRIWQPLRLT
jgi:hypothetical protein